MSFLGKVVIITGAGGGIGSATSLHFAKLKAKLVLVDFNSSALTKTKEECVKNGALGENIYTILADLKQEDSLKSVIENTVERFGRIDVLINNAATTSKQSIFEENYMAKYQETFDVNLKAPMLLTHLAVPHLVLTKGNVINMTSVGGIHPLPDLYIYNASKAALRHFTKCAAKELASKGVRVNCIAPAGVRTEMVKLVGVKDIEEFEIKRTSQLPLKRMIECSEVAELIEFLASDKAKSITGAEFVIDAGHLLGGGTPDYSK